MTDDLTASHNKATPDSEPLVDGKSPREGETLLAGESVHVDAEPGGMTVTGEAVSGDAETGEAEAGELIETGEAGSGRAVTGEAEAGELIETGEAGSGRAVTGEAEAGELIETGEAGSGRAVTGEAEAGELIETGEAGSGRAVTGEAEAGELIETGEAGSGRAVTGEAAFGEEPQTGGAGADESASSDMSQADEAVTDEASGDIDSERPRTRLRSLLEWLIVIVCAFALAALMQVFLLQAFSIPSSSMEPTLTVGNRVIVYKMGYRFHDVNRGDVVVFSNPDGSPDADELIKRVIAVGGETFELRDGRVRINGLLLDEPYLGQQGNSFPKQPMQGCLNEPAPDRCVVPEGRLLVLGDNREASRDGRYFGTIDEDTVVGRAFMKYWPPNDIGGM